MIDMSSAAASPLASSVEKTNGAKLSRLLIDGGTTVLRKVFDSYHHPARLAADLKSNYSILNNLLHKRVLKRYQWDKLFPPGGAVPDSSTFDITLLFLLLTTICGLNPPLSGWHATPLPSDNSLEANLVRVKFYRKALYCDATTTGVEERTFSTMWTEISGVLVSLGLDQAEVDKLKAEKGGEQDYNDELIEGVDREGDSKPQIKNMHQAQTKSQQAVEDVPQTQTKTQKTVEKVFHGKKEHQLEVEDVRHVVETLREERDKYRPFEATELNGSDTPHQDWEELGRQISGAVKKGSPTAEVLQYVSVQISHTWIWLGRQLGFHEAELDEFDQKLKIADKAYAMLLAWKQKDASGATYSVLYEALRHELIKRNDLAEEFCCD